MLMFSVASRGSSDDTLDRLLKEALAELDGPRLLSCVEPRYRLMSAPCKAASTGPCHFTGLPRAWVS